MTSDYIYIGLALFDGCLGLLLAFSLTSDAMLHFPKWHRFFVSIGAAGLLSQSVLLIAHLNGHSVAEFWWSWGAKDIYVGGIALTYAVTANRIAEIQRYRMSAKPSPSKY